MYALMQKIQSYDGLPLALMPIQGVLHGAALGAEAHHRPARLLRVDGRAGEFRRDHRHARTLEALEAHALGVLLRGDVEHPLWLLGGDRVGRAQPLVIGPVLAAWLAAFLAATLWSRSDFTL